MSSSHVRRPSYTGLSLDSDFPPSGNGSTTSRGRTEGFATVLFQRKYILAFVGFIFVISLYSAKDSEHIKKLPELLRLSRGGGVAASLAYSHGLWKVSVAKRAALIAKLRSSQDGNAAVGVTAFDHNRHTIWDLFPPNFNSPYPVERIGKMGEGGKFISGLDRLAREKECVMYSFGVERDSSAELEVLQRTNCKVFAYDLSVDTIGPEILAAPRDIQDRVQFHRFGIAGIDAPYATPIMYTLQTLMKQNGHHFIDILKVDVEAWEYEVFDSIMQAFPDELPFGQLLIELHAHRTNHVGNSHAPVDGNFLVDWFERLEAAGLRAYQNELNYPSIGWSTGPYYIEYALLNVKSSYNPLLTD